jgi:thiol-disulfide isomerase/thioredoxin
MENKAKIFIACIVGALVIVIGLGMTMNKPKISKLDGFAQCLKDSGAEFYGAFWCPHCQAQKAMFGSAVKFLPYIECSNPDQTQMQICIDKKIDGYPTWIFKDGSRLSGEIALTTLAEKTQCVLPE